MTPTNHAAVHRHIFAVLVENHFGVLGVSPDFSAPVVSTLRVSVSPRQTIQRPRGLPWSPSIC